ncbi:MAG: SDR family oxidoreductase [Xanthobacteraceae bacterium]|jgi:NAD(P)-dependent dehydrogenase (short-subunit alcohol dehydrogenase family)
MAQDGTKAVALVTGASYGVGSATAFALARAGFNLAVTATRQENLTTTEVEAAALGAQVLPLELDLRAAPSIEATVTAVLDRYGRLDVLVNNAAVNLRRKAVDVSRDEWNGLIETNLTGTFFLTQQVGRHLIAQRSPGRIVTIASAHAFVGAAERSTYGISKAALVQMTRMLAIEWAEYGIRVNAVAPGRLDTPSPSRAGTATDKAYMDAMLKRIPLHRLATAEQVAGTVAFLASPAADTITGQTIIIDGGITAA